MKKILQRTCIGCNKKKNKNDLLKIVKNKEGNITVDKNYKMQGRGAYICKNIDCLDIIIKKKKLEKNFLCKIETNIYEDIRDAICDKE